MGVGESDSLRNDVLNSIEYPGRFIVLGMTPEKVPVAVYGITGRSPSSQARRLVHTPILNEYAEILVEPTDPAVIQQGNIDLLVYPAMRFLNGIVVSNGKHTKSVYEKFQQTRNPLQAIVEGHASWSYEPDAPNNTPRIAGCIDEKSGALGIIKHFSGELPMRQYFEFPLVPGEGMFISTYSGENKNPLPCFSGEPLRVDIAQRTSKSIAREFYDAFAPREEKPDMRVSVAAVSYNDAYLFDIINRIDGDTSA